MVHLLLCYEKWHKKRTVDATIPNKLNLMKNRIEKTPETMTEENVVLSEIQKWILEQGNQLKKGYA